MTNLYFNVTFGVITKVAGTLGKKVVRKIGDTLVEMGVDSKYVKNFFTEEYGGVSWDDSPGTGGSGNHGSGGTGSGSGSHGTGYIPGGGSPDYWNFIDAWELISKKYGEKVASILQEFGEDGLKLAEKYGDDLASIIDNLEPTEAKKAVSLINSYGDDALEMFKEGKNFDEVKKVVEGGYKATYKILNISSAEDVNKIFKDIMGYEPPYKPGTSVTEIQLTKNATYVRVYDKVNSRMQGGWVMKAEDIAGLTPQEIQNKFALPNTPKYICDVNLEAGTRLRTGEVNPLFGFDGGGQQYDLIINGKKVGTFTNERIIGQ